MSYINEPQNSNMNKTGAHFSAKSIYEDALKARTPSPGRDYSDLLHDTSSNKWYPELGESEEESDKESPSGSPNEFGEKDIEIRVKLLEKQVRELEIELSKSKSESNFAHAQLDIIKREKELHVSQHAKEKLNWERDLRELQERLIQERKQFNDEASDINRQLQEMQISFRTLKAKKEQQAEAFKNRIREDEERFIEVVREKDKKIEKLIQQIEELAQQPRIRAAKSEDKLKIEPKKKKPVKKILKPQPLSPSRSRGNGKQKYISEISHMIVALEKEQAELKQKVKDLEYDSGMERDRRKLKELIKRNEERLNEAIAIQEEMVKVKFLSADLDYS
ncbi:unnamed protein product [Blepharisma stoltei]|uniref:Uncharacterized protein n=1 Tax=Blepharisma stoltei TaxID=1481888 RepID=A0AAU9K631_9CILI|nr:unnamed protein product [Blepharisma stoltei]